MSLILDALKRAERERQAPPSSALGDLPASRATRRGPRVPWRWLIIAALLVGAFTAWKKFHKRAPAPAPVVAQAPRPMPPAPIVATPAPAQGPIMASPPPVIPGTEGMTSLEEIAQGEAEMAPPPQPAPGPAPTPAAKPQPKPAATKATPAPASKPAPAKPAAAAQPAPTPIEETPTPEEVPAPAPEPQAAPVEPPPREVSPVLTQPAQYRKLKEMPPEFRADFPQLTIEVHVYQQIPQQRFVIINGRRYRQGDTLAEGPQIFEIAPDGIVVDYRNERLLVPIAR